MKPLPGGLKLDGKKDSTLISWTIARPSPPRRVRLPLIQPPAAQARPRIQVGDRVRVGEALAEPVDSLGVTIHASVSGKVSAIAKFPHPLLRECEAIEILSDGKDEPMPGMGSARSGWEMLSPSEVIQILKEAGVAGMGQETFPPHFQIEASLPFQVDTLILNGCESEPYLTSDHCVMMSHPVEVLKGGEILRRALGAQKLIVVLEDNKEEVAELLKSKVFFHRWSQAEIQTLPSRYPQEREEILVRHLLGRSIPTGHFSWEAGVVVHSVATAYAVYEAVVLQKPLYERALTIAGECVAQPANFWIRLGTPVEEAVKYSRGFLREPGKVILGGPMTGPAIENLETSVMKETRAILGLPPEVVKPESLEPCIRCNQCVESCPVFISPVMITLAAEKDLFELAQDYGASLCIECGNCTYVCPAKRPMVELIQYANAR